MSNGGKFLHEILYCAMPVKTCFSKGKLHNLFCLNGQINLTEFDYLQIFIPYLLRKVGREQFFGSQILNIRKLEC